MTTPSATSDGTEPVWYRYLSAQDREVFAGAGYGARAGLGARPAVLVVDVNFNFLGDEPLPLLESIRTWPNSCGDVGWSAVPRIAELLTEARWADVPVVYSTGGPRGGPNDLGPGRWADKNHRQGTTPPAHPPGNRIVAEISPEPGEVVIEKQKPSAFFGTELTAHLIELGVDSLIVCGTTTSGCVRATVIDAFSLNFRVAVVEDCTFDRGEASHAISLFDLDQKYADVVTLDQACEVLRSVAPRPARPALTEEH